MAFLTFGQMVGGVTRIYLSNLDLSILLNPSCKYTLGSIDAY